MKKSCAGWSLVSLQIETLSPILRVALASNYMNKLKRSKKEVSLLQQSLQEWQENGYLDEEKCRELEDSLESTSFNWQDISSSSFFIAVGCMVIAVLALFADQWLMGTLNQLIETSDGFKSITLAITAIILFYLGWKKQQKQSGSTYSNETLFSLGAIATAMSIGYAGYVIDTNERLIPYLLALAAFIYLPLAVLFRSQLLWVFGLLALAGWFGSATAHSADWQAYYRGMNYPLRFVVFGGLLSALSLALPLHPVTEPFFRITQITGIFCLLLCLWLMSIFGNMGHYDLWEQVSQSRFLGWSLLLLIASLLAAWWGHRKERLSIRDLGITFLVINLYTRYIEYCWELMPKSIFFALMALSFWLIGKQAEKAWKPEKHPV